MRVEQRNFGPDWIEVTFSRDDGEPIAAISVKAIGERVSERPATFYQVDSRVRIEANGVVMQGDTREAEVPNDR